MKVGVVRDDHELGPAWPVQDCVIGAREVCYLKGKHFHVEVCLTSKCYGQIDQPKGNDLEPGYDSVEWSTGWSYRRSRQTHGVVSLSIEEVEAALAIHDDMR